MTQQNFLLLFTVLQTSQRRISQKQNKKWCIENKVVFRAYQSLTCHECTLLDEGTVERVISYQDYSITNSIGPNFKTRKFSWARHFHQLACSNILNNPNVWNWKEAMLVLVSLCNTTSEFTDLVFGFGSKINKYSSVKAERKPICHCQFYIWGLRMTCF